MDLSSMVTSIKDTIGLGTYSECISSSANISDSTKTSTASWLPSFFDSKENSNDSLEACMNSIGGGSGSMGEKSYIDDDSYVQAAKNQAWAITKQWLTDVGIQLAFAMYDRWASNSISEYQFELADRKMKLVEEIQAHAEKFYPYENYFVQHAFGIPDYEPDYCQAAAGAKDITERSKDTALQGLQDNLKRLCVCFNKCDYNSFLRQAQLISVSNQDAVMRYEEVKEDNWNEFIFNLKMSAIGLGDGKLPAAVRYAEATVNPRMEYKSAIGDFLQFAGAGLSQWVNSSSTPKIHETQIYRMPGVNVPDSSTNLKVDHIK